MSLAVFHQGSQNVDPVAGEPFEYQPEYFLFGEFYHRFPREIADGMADAGIEKAQEIVDFSRCPYGASRIAVDRFLLYGYDRTQAGYFVNVRALHVPEHVARIGRECLDITPLAFGIDRVERQ